MVVGKRGKPSAENRSGGASSETGGTRIEVVY
eukprot:SAG31_NODE_18476_length_635_cov_0.582090_1_plen_31_part_10